jgi:uncharacterized protein YbjQ (UPF0145 family)
LFSKQRLAFFIHLTSNVGIDLDYETVGNSGSMLMVTCSGTAVII